ncbi:hypothetical protein BV25DRAFT_1837013 [Artomyces pyxidatus]|uniref:Uncharacterized protein n=1 Tax=Artomyces pyxidatus TaxID=48021 RepID=A0ACB8T6W2_9AGAM|nr:hypothetical protein BV25DRAFT_1837013 [Artomyces pyxidatus]
MCYFTPSGAAICCFLEPLDEIPIPSPFPDAHICLSGLGVTLTGVLDGTPSSMDQPLLTPIDPEPTGLGMGGGSTLFPPLDYDFPVPDGAGAPPPPAPLLKDLDSFSDGTALGSFNYSLTSEQDEGRPSVAFSPTHPTRSIEIWRDHVLRCTTMEASVNCEERATKRRRLAEVGRLGNERPSTLSASGRPLPTVPESPRASAQGVGSDEPVPRDLGDVVIRPPSAPPGLG